MISRKSEFLFLISSFVSPFRLDSGYLLRLFLCVNDWLHGGVGRVILPYKFPVGEQLSCL